MNILSDNGASISSYGMCDTYLGIHLLPAFATCVKHHGCIRVICVRDTKKNPSTTQHMLLKQGRQKQKAVMVESLTVSHSLNSGQSSSVISNKLLIRSLSLLKVGIVINEHPVHHFIRAVRIIDTFSSFDSHKYNGIPYFPI